MFWFHLRLRNPFNKRDDAYIHNFYNKVWRITKNKSVEIQISRWNNLTNLIDIQFNIEPSGHDHAGADFNVTLLHFYFMIHLYDTGIGIMITIVGVKYIVKKTKLMHNSY